jgi:tRNA-specific 2-thiouridylase
MQQKAKEMGIDYIATGHYAKTEFNEEFKRWTIKKSNAGKKDQSYVLWNIPKDIIEYIVFPLGDFETKDEIRKIASDNNLKVANKPDSEDICFVPDGDYKKFLENNSDIKPKKGNIVNSKGEILGEHTGLYNYTIGQRKGLGIALGSPKHVTHIDAQSNTVTLGDHDELYTTVVRAKNYHVRDIDWLHETAEVEARIRYKSPAVKGQLTIVNGQLQIDFAEPVWGVAPGQSLVVYKDGLLVGGGIIEEV